LEGNNERLAHLKKYAIAGNAADGMSLESSNISSYSHSCVHMFI